MGDTAREIIRKRLSMGLSPRPEPAAFAREMFDKDFDNFIDNAENNSLLFFDRSFVDSANLVFHTAPDDYATIEKSLLDHRFNKKVFVTPPWKEIYRTDSERDHSFDHAVAVFDELSNWYAKHDYTVILIPKDAVERRAEFVLKEIVPPID
jgi:predicted ATPase